MRRWYLLCLLLVSGLVLADDPELSIFVFEDGGPVSGLQLVLGDTAYGSTDEAGALMVSPPPAEYELQLRRGEQVLLSRRLLLVEDEVIQLLVTLREPGEPLVDVETSQPDKAVAEETDEPAPGESLPPGTLLGVVTNAEDGAPVENARVFVSGSAVEARTGADGQYQLQLPPGSYSISVLSAGFNIRTEDGIEVASETTVQRDLTVTPSGSELPEFVVVEPYIEGSLASVFAERRESDAVTDVLSAEQISRAGDSDAAGALKRVTGLTLVDGQFVYVRGLGERYSSILLNGATIPSPDPTRRVVPLDLFPTDVLQSVVVQKTAAGNMPGEFGGGTVQLRTVSFPDSFVAKLGVSTTYNDLATFQDAPTYDGGDRDFTGFDDGTRDLPESVAEAAADGEFLRPRSLTNPDGLTQEEFEVLGEDLAESSLYATEEDTLHPDFGLSGSLGNSFDFGQGNRWGFLTAFQYGNSWQNLDEVRNTFLASNSGLQPGDSLAVRRSVQDIDLSLFANTGVTFGEDHRLSFNSMYLRQTSNETKISEGEEDNQILRRFELEWVENELLNNQLLGSHTLGLPDLGLDIGLDWQYTDATASRVEPNTRRWRRDDDDEDGVFIFSTRADSNVQEFEDLEDNLSNWTVDLSVPFDVRRLAVKLGVGVGEVERDREASIRSFSFEGRIRGDDLFLSQEEILNADFIGNQLRLRESTQPTDNYVAEQLLDAKYVSADLNLLEKYRLTLGLRQEDNLQSVITSDLSNPNAPPVVGEIDETKRLPSAAFTWSYSDNAQFRLGYAESLSRPDFRELSPAPFIDPILDIVTVGNPDLETTDIVNYDARWEYYFTPSNTFSIAAFYKEFTSPIEKTFSSGGSAKIIRLQNALSAELIGAEVDFYSTLEWLNRFDWLDNLSAGPIGPFDWGNFFVAANYAWIDSTVEIDANQTNQTNTSDRALQGQSPYVVNFQFGYTHPEGLQEWTLLYNEVGERIAQAGVRGQPDIFEQPFPQLDFVYKRQLWDRWRMSVKLQNLLDSEVEFTQGEEVTRRYKKGRELGLSLTWAY